MASCALCRVIRLRRNYRPMAVPPGSLDGIAGENMSGEPLQLLFVGDSLCCGVGGSAAGLFQEALCTKLSTLCRRAVAWRTIAIDGGDVRQIREKLLKAEVRQDLDVAVVLCGVNDFKKLLTECRMPRNFRRDLGALCEAIRMKAPRVRVIVPSIPGLFYQAPLLQRCLVRETLGFVFDRFELQKARVASSLTGVEVCIMPKELRPTPDDPDLWAVDSIHPSSKAYGLVGDWMGKTIAPPTPAKLGA